MTAQPDRTAGQLVDDLTSDTARLVRSEIRKGQQELLATAKEASKGAALLGGAAVLGALAAGTSAAFVVRTLDTFLPRPVAPLVATVLYGGAAVAVGAVGWEELKRMGSLLPEETIASIREDLRAVHPQDG